MPPTLHKRVERQTHGKPCYLLPRISCPESPGSVEAARISLRSRPAIAIFSLHLGLYHFRSPWGTNLQGLLGGLLLGTHSMSPPWHLQHLLECEAGHALFRECCSGILYHVHHAACLIFLMTMLGCVCLE